MEECPFFFRILCQKGGLVVRKLDDPLLLAMIELFYMQFRVWGPQFSGTPSIGMVMDRLLGAWVLGGSCWGLGVHSGLRFGFRV